MLACVGMAAVSEDAETIDRRTEISYEDIKHIRWLGSGAHGHVFLGSYEGDAVAVKRIKDAESAQRESSMLLNLVHENIVSIVGSCLSGPSFAIVLEYCPGALYDIIHTLQNDITPRIVLDYASQIARGMEYLHANHVIHRDLKVLSLFLNVENHSKIVRCNH
jgi:serine/threonine protein kinase